MSADQIELTFERPEPVRFYDSASDCGFLLLFLGDHKEHTLTEILRASFAERGCGLTVHSRVADLRRDGYTIEWRHVPGEKRGNASAYRLISQPQSSEENAA